MNETGGVLLEGSNSIDPKEGTETVSVSTIVHLGKRSNSIDPKEGTETRGQTAGEFNLRPAPIASTRKRVLKQQHVADTRPGRIRSNSIDPKEGTETQGNH